MSRARIKAEIDHVKAMAESARATAKVHQMDSILLLLEGKTDQAIQARRCEVENLDSAKEHDDDAASLQKELDATPALVDPSKVVIHWYREDAGIGYNGMRLSDMLDGKKTGPLGSGSVFSASVHS